MRRLLPLLLVLAMAACDNDVSGTYQLVSIDGEELPVAWEFFGIVSIASGFLTLSDSIYEYTLTTSDRAGNLDSHTESGTFTLDDAHTICLSSPTSSDPPPPPPPPGYTAPSGTPAVDAPAQQPESEKTWECNGQWDGDQIIASDAESVWIFQR